MAKLLESTVDATPVSCEPSPRYNPKEAVDVKLELTLPEDVILVDMSINFCDIKVIPTAEVPILRLLVPAWYFAYVLSPIVKVSPVIVPLALILPDAVIFANNTSLPVMAKLLESTVDATPVSCEPSPKYNPKEAVDVVLALMLPDDVKFANNTLLPVIANEAV